MPNISIMNPDGAEVGTMNLPERLFGVRWNADLVHQVMVAERSNRRQPLAHTKDRSEVAGGGRKPWKQKHTGRARASSSRSPLWSGGGITFGPRNDRNFTKKVNVKMRRAALAVVLSRKLTDGEIRVVDAFVPREPKTKVVAAMLRRVVGVAGESLCVVPAGSTAAFRATRNIRKTAVVTVSGVNLTACLEHRFLVFDQQGLDAFIEAQTKAKNPKS